MLSRKEREIVRAVISFCGERESCIISENDLFALVDIRKKTIKEIRSIVDSLVLDGYFDLVKCKRGEETVLCITPKLKARLCEREKSNSRAVLSTKYFWRYSARLRRFWLREFYTGYSDGTKEVYFTFRI